MMPEGLLALLATAVGIGILHTVLGPDHYVPFIAMSRSGAWSPAKTGLITALSGLGHVLSSVALGSVGIALGLAVERLTALEARRGELAAWLFLAVGLTYTVWGVWHALRGRPHRHRHSHPGEHEHEHEHTHALGHAHLHPSKRRGPLTPWVLFTLFVFGPCEVLIPLLIYPAAVYGPMAIALVAIAFGAATIATMLAIVLLACFGMERLRIGGLERYSHAAAGLAVLACGAAIKWLGL